MSLNFYSSCQGTSLSISQFYQCLFLFYYSFTLIFTISVLCYAMFFLNLLSLVHFVAVMAILGLKMALACEHLHLVPQYPFVMSTLDDTKIMKFISLPMECEQAHTVSLIFSLFFVWY